MDLFKPIYLIEKDTGDKLLMTSINFPLGCPSGKDIVCQRDGEDCSEWFAIDDVELIDNEL